MSENTYSMEQVGVKPVITDIVRIDEAALQAAQGVIMDHNEKLHERFHKSSSQQSPRK